MAKKKNTAATQKRASAAKPTTDSVKSPAKKASPVRSSVLCNEEIGNTAGVVWQTLLDQGEQSAAALKKSVDAPGDLVMAAVGWLAREEKLRFDLSGRTSKISLR